MTDRRRRTAALALAVATALLTLTVNRTPSATAAVGVTAIGGERVVANIVWRQRVYSRPDLMSTTRADERDGWPGDGQVWYLPSSQVAGTVPVYRLYHPNIGGHMDHMDSLTAGEGGYQTEWDRTLGYAYTNSAAVPGLSRLVRTYRSATGDHGTRSNNEPVMSGFTDEPLNAYGWSRYNNQNTSLLSTSAGGVTVSSNKVAGGAVWHWWHNGTQYINNVDYGRQMQAALFFKDGTRPHNPTEAGDAYSFQGLPVHQRHGSPLAGAWTFTNGQSTRAVPLDWDVWQTPGGNQDRPVIWRQLVLGKDLTLNHNNLGPVAKYTTVVSAPAAMTVDLLHMPVAFLRADFNRYYAYDPSRAAGSRLSTRTPPACDDRGDYWSDQNFGGPIVATADGSRAMGIYAVHRSHGGSATGYALHDQRCGSPGGELDPGTSALQAAFVGTIPAGTSYYNAYVMTGTLAEVQNHMQTLYTQGAR
jgi:hypothetical protein